MGNMMMSAGCIAALAPLDRGQFLKTLALLAGGTALLPLLDSSAAESAIVPADDDRLHVERALYPGKTGKVRAYLARPAEEGKWPGVVVVHENRGLNPHIEDVARRVALEGFIAVAPDALSPMGGTPEDSDEARTMIGKLDMESTNEDFVAAAAYLKTHPKSTGKVGCTGFCWGGAMANQMAVRSPDVSASAPYYGRQPATEDVPRIKAAMMLHYAELDERINRGIPEYEAALKKAGVDYQVFIYEGAKHAFNNDTNPGRYHKEAAKLAWQRTIAFFKEKLKT
jgi:carboxymethylenebutenolidase